MNKIKILWIDDEIDLLKVQILFLEAKGYHVDTANNGEDALEILQEKKFNIIFLDEHMPGLTGLEVLPKIKIITPTTPVVMVTKSEAEDIMDEAIGSKISDYLIKPVNPNQILLSIKKNVDEKRLITEKTTEKYQIAFRNLSMQINDCRTFDEWTDVYKKLVYWELELERTSEKTMDEILSMQKDDANYGFSKFIKSNYKEWIKEDADHPFMVHEVFKKRIFPLLDNNENVFLIVIDNFRFDQWKMLQPLISDYFSLESEELISTLLPTSTQYARNAMFAGLTPLQISEMFPQFWSDEKEEGSKNDFERELIETLLKRYRKDIPFSFNKVFNDYHGKKVISNLKTNLRKQLNVVVFNFVDMLSHARTDMQMIRELAKDDAAYRSLTKTWFEHSSLLELMKELRNKDVKIVITTDHGTIKVQNPIKVVGEKDTTTNLRYKQGKSLAYKKNEVFVVTKPEEIGLPKSNISSSFIFTMNRDFFVYPNNFNHYMKYYRDTFQHGGISMEEMLIPLLIFNPKN